MKCKNIGIMGIPEGEGKNGTEEIFEIVSADSFPKLMIDTKAEI